MINLYINLNPFILLPIERELQRIDEEVIKQMFNDVKILRDNRYSQANELHRRYSIKYLYKNFSEISKQNPPKWFIGKVPFTYER